MKDLERKKRQDFSYDLWGDLAKAKQDGSRFVFKMNPKYGKGESIALNSCTGIHPNLIKYKVDIKVKENNLLFYKEDSFYLGKVMQGKTLIQSGDKQNILLNKGDIFCLSGNYILNKNYFISMNKEVELVGIFNYHQDIMSTFKKNDWEISIIENILEHPDLKNGIMLNKTYELEKIFDELYSSMKNDNRFTAFIKSSDLFYYFVKMMQNNEHTKSKTYTEQQVETVIRIKNFLDENLDQYYSMPKLAKKFNISLSRMQSIFTEYYDLSPYKYHLNKRLEKAHSLIINSDMKITAIASSLGFSSYDNFFKAYKTKYNCTPSKERMT